MLYTRYLMAVIVLSAGLIPGCRKAAEYRDVLYFTGTEQSPEVRVAVDGPENIGISVTSSSKVKEDITIKIQPDPSQVEVFNKLNGTAYEPLPEASYALETSDVVIKSGFNVSDVARFSILSLDDFKEGVTYCAPITIADVKGGLPVLQSSRTTFLIIKQTIVTQAASLASNRYFKVEGFANDPSLSSVPNLTLECRVYVNSFQTANPFITSVIGIEEGFLLRFGDVSIANNQLQLAGGQVVGSGKFPVTSKAFFSTGQWYHIAAVYNGSTIALYVNGTLDNYTDAQSGGIDLTSTWADGFLIGRSAGGRYLNGYVSEARVWTKALTQKELQNNLCYVDPTSPGLLAYWRFNGEITGNSVADLTGHGYTAVANNSISWVPGVRCPQ